VLIVNTPRGPHLLVKGYARCEHNIGAPICIKLGIEMAYEADNIIENPDRILWW